MKDYNLKKEILKRQNFKIAMEYAKRKKHIYATIDTVEKFYMDKDNACHEALPEGKEWTCDGSSSIDVSFEYFPNLKTWSGCCTFVSSVIIWIKEFLQEPELIKFTPFSIWSSWVFVLDSWSAVRYDMVKKDHNINSSVDRITKDDVLKYLETNEHYKKLNEDFFYLVSDPTCVISMINHDLRDGYSHKKAIELLNIYINSIFIEEPIQIFIKD